MHFTLIKFFLFLTIINMSKSITEKPSNFVNRTVEKLALSRQYGCPVCDSSVYSYCDYKMQHDACCCTGQLGAAVTPQCQYSNCQIFYAKSCYEHQLIRSCCCENPFQ